MTWARHLKGDVPVAVMMAFWVGLVLPAIASSHLVSGGTLWAYHLSASVVAHPVDVLFMPGASPVAAFLYAPFAAFGFSAYRVAHAVTMPLTLLLVMRVAATRGSKTPALAALVVFASPTFVAAGPAAVPGADAVLLVAFALYALDVERASRVGGLLLGLLALTRPEAAVLAFGIAAARRDRVAAGVAVAMLATFVAGGMLSQGGGWPASWLLTPSLAGPPAAPADAGLATSEALAAVIAVCPVIGLLPFVTRGGATRLDGLDGAVAAAFGVLVIGLGLSDVGSVGLGPERLLPALPLILPIASRALDQLSRGEESTYGVIYLVAWGVVAIALPVSAEQEPLGVVVVAWALLVAAARVFPRAARVLVVLVVLGGFHLVSTARLSTEDQSFGLREALAAASADGLVGRDARVVSDIPTLAMRLEDSAGLEPSGVSFLWTGRAARPLPRGGDALADLRWVLEDHPFGEPILDDAPEALGAGDVVFVSNPSLATVYAESPLMRIVHRGRVSVYERLALSVNDASSASVLAAKASPKSSGASARFHTSQAARVSVSSKNAATRLAFRLDAPARSVRAR